MANGVGHESLPRQPGGGAAVELGHDGFAAGRKEVSPQRLTPDDAFGLRDDDRAACRARIAGLRNEGPFTPPSERGTLVYPSSIGGAHWGGVTYDPVRQIAVVPVNRVAANQTLPRV